MPRILVTVAAAAIAMSSAHAEIVELTVSGSTASSDGRFIPGTGTLATFDTDWSIVVVYEDTNEMGFHEAAVVDAYMIVDGVRRNFDASFDPNPRKSNTQTLTGFPSPEFGMQAQLFFDLGLSDGRSATVHTEAYSGQFFPTNGYQGDIALMPVGFSLEDFAGVFVTADLGDALSNSGSDVLGLGGEWFLYADSISARVVPAPANALLLGVGMTFASRRRR